MKPGYTEYVYRNTAPGAAAQYLWPLLLRMVGSPPARVVDLGCGNGALVHALVQAGFDAYGVDASASGVAMANRVLPGRFFQAPLEPVAIAGLSERAPFDVVVCAEVIEHLYAPRDLLRLSLQLLRPGGTLVLSTPYHGYLKNLALAATGRLDKHFTALWDGGHIKFFSRRTLTHMLNEAGFELSAFEGAGRLPFLWKSMVLKAHAPLRLPTAP